MVDPEFELQRLKRTMSIKGFLDEEISYVVDLARQDIETAIDNLVSNAVQAAADAGMSKDAYDFVEQLEIKRTQGNVEIATTSGQTDFSLPPFPMLPNLLKNAKTAKDGSKYKVIPVGGNSSGPKPSRRLTSYSSLSDVQQEINQQRQAERESRRLALKEARELTFTGQSAGVFSGLQKARQFLKNRQVEEQQEEIKPKGQDEVQFRTASSKQNPAQDWVLPAVDRDMSKILSEINRQLDADIHSTVLNIVRQYEVML